MRLMRYCVLAGTISFGILLQSCIHDYPHAVRGNSSDKGENPTAINANIDVSFNLDWESLLYEVNMSAATKARNDRPHRFVIGVLKDGETVCQDLNYLTSEEFSLGKLNHKLSVPLEATGYEIAVWYDMQDEEGNYSFDTDDLKKVSLLNYSTTNADALQCAFSSDYLDLSSYVDSNREIEVTKELELSHAGARFEIVATDIQEFINTYKTSLNQGDKFTVHLTFSYTTPNAFNLFGTDLKYDEILKLSGRMRLPFAEYDELKIAEGFIFCRDEDEVSVKLEVRNSSHLPICSTEYFSFPVKKGYITIVKGDFLSSPVDGFFSIDTIWEGEIVIEI